MKKTKIIATLGPSSNDVDTIVKMIKSGANMFRLNFSHGTHEYHKNSYNNIRKAEEICQTYVGIMADLQGPKIRVSSFINQSEILENGQVFNLHLQQVDGTKEQVTLPHKEVFDVVAKGDLLLINDGKIKLEIISNKDFIIKAKVLVGGEISNFKGVNIPSAILPIMAVTEKDFIDLEFSLGLGVDWVALSFVQKFEDVQIIIDKVAGRAKVLSKLEKPSACEDLKNIVKYSNGIMIARGDLGVECPPETVPVLQKRIITECRKQGKPVIVATQMLESMINEAVATRAEINDVANAIFDGADAVMLSGETAVGKYPVESVSVMNDISLTVEKSEMYNNLMQEKLPIIDETNVDALSLAVINVASNINSKAIVPFTATGSTALRIARLRPNNLILALTPAVKTARWLSLVWGVYAIKTKNIEENTDIIGKANRISRRNNYTNVGDKIVVTAGLPFGTPGLANLLQISTIKETDI